MAQNISETALTLPEDWTALDAERDAFNGRDCGVKFSNVPHKQSAFPDLPMRGITHGVQGVCPASGGSHPAALERIKKRSVALFPELTAKKRAPIERQSAPHPDSAYSHLPLTGLGLEGANPVRKWTLTAGEKRTLSARPLRHTLPADAAIARQAAA